MTGIEWHSEAAKSAPIRAESAMARLRMKVEKVRSGCGFYVRIRCGFGLIRSHPFGLVSSKASEYRKNIYIGI